MLLYQCLVYFIPISLMKACSANNLGDGPASFKCNREARGKPFIITAIVDPSALRLCTFTYAQMYGSECIVGSMLTHINGSFICTINSEVAMHALLDGEITSLSYVNSFEEWQTIKKGEVKQRTKLNVLNKREPNKTDTPDQMSLLKNGFCAQGIC